MDTGSPLRRRLVSSPERRDRHLRVQPGARLQPIVQAGAGLGGGTFLLAPTPAAATPGLLDGYGFDQFLSFRNTSAAAFGQIEWLVTDRLRVLPGLRFNYDQKNVDFNQTVYGGLQTTDPVLVALKLSVLAPQASIADVDDTNTSGQLTVAFKVSPSVNTYGTYSTGFKSVGLNLNGVPTDALGNPILSAATVKPEDVRHVEFGVKTEPLPGVTANFTVFHTGIKDYQTQVVNSQVGVLRGYLANAEKVRVRGAEFDGNARINRRLSLYGALAYTDGIYVSFPDAPPPLEDTGGPQVKDISGSVLPGISKWALTLGGEYSSKPATVFSRAGEFFGAVDTSYRSEFSSSPSASRYMVVDGYGLINARAGFRWSDGWSVFLWSRNLLDKNYFEFLTAQPGNSGLYVGLPGDPRTIGLTVRMNLRGRPLDTTTLKGSDPSLTSNSGTLQSHREHGSATIGAPNRDGTLLCVDRGHVFQRVASRIPIAVGLSLHSDPAHRRPRVLRRRECRVGRACARIQPGHPARRAATVFPRDVGGLLDQRGVRVLLLIAYPTKALTNPLFYVKLTLIGFGIVLALRIRREVEGVRSESDAPRVARTLAAASLVCWVAVIFAGRLLATCTRLTVDSSC